MLERIFIFFFIDTKKHMIKHHEILIGAHRGRKVCQQYKKHLTNFRNGVVEEFSICVGLYLVLALSSFLN